MADKSDPAPDAAPPITDLSKMPAAEFKALLKQTLRLAEEALQNSTDRAWADLSKPSAKE
ncbi:MAG TPA: hypothetical protein HPQ04_08225 [Rhodospirillaceae bacterium]|nr:hypothetical protein [Rhodospirillaceae bacterium]